MKKIILLLSILYCSIADAQYTKLLDFTGGNGSKPHGDLISDGTFLYGMTYDGGNLGNGNIFKIKPDGSGYSMLKQFSGGTNGYFPYGSLLSTGGFLYGMTFGGGTGGAGSIFKIKTDGTSFSYFFNFTFSATGTGSRPTGTLITDGAFLYGMTSQGGANNFGTVFKVKSDGTGFSKLLEFTGTNGKYPQGSLLSDGTYLYGMTSAGGTDDSGIVFKIKPDGTGYTKLLDFTGVNGKNPQGSLVSDGTYLCGMTAWGGATNGGTVFKILPNGTGYTKLMDLTGVPGGFFPYGSLIYNGTFLYGMTTYGPGAMSCGTVFKIKPDGTGYVSMFGFSPTNGSQPMGSLLSDGSFLYGMTMYGGAGNTACTVGKGVVFKLGINTVGINESNTAVDITISPNPTKGVFQITSDVLQITSIEVYSLIGEAVHIRSNPAYDQSIVVDLSGQPSGIYFLKMICQDGNYAVKKIIKD